MIQKIASIINDQEKRYNNLITKLYSACDIDEDNVVRIDTLPMSNILEEEFLRVGLLKNSEE